MCSGYYNYGQGHRPDFPGIERFGGQIAHPQQWPQDLNYDGKKVLIIGSGATAVTLVPAMAERAAHVTMLQRSPSYVVARPGVDKIANFLRQTLPLRWAYTLTRLKNAALGMYMLRMCRTKPERAKAFFIDQVRQALGPDYDVAKHFTPRYRPWEQRLCLVPDGDLFQAIKGGKASVMTDHIDTFTETGVTLRSGESIEAEVVVPATGLELQALAGVTVSVDGQSMDVSQAVNYKGVMYCGVPNFAVTFGYTKASWTLKADLTSLYVCRLLNHMQRTGLRRCAPRPADPAMPLQPWTEFSSGYFERALAQLPKQGSEKPWKLNQAWLPDVLALRFGSIDDGQMVFSA
jgi:cation diffusion facilitator CzcD-associated flavoprotein CzcO